MERDKLEQIDKLIGQMECSKDFRCKKWGFEKLCNAVDIGLDNFLECIEEDASYCDFSFFFGNGRYCKCPVRIYLAKHLNK